MGRSSYEQAAKTREKILENASGLFRKHGIDNVSVAEVMATAGMTTGGFYKHFHSKDALIEEVVELSFQNSAAAWRRTSERVSEEITAAIVSYYLQHKPPGRTCPLIAFASHVCSDASNTASIEAYKKGAEDLYTQFIDQVGGSRATPDSERHAKVLFAAMVGANLLAKSTRDASWARSVKDAVIDEAAL